MNRIQSKHFAGALFAVVLALTGFAHAEHKAKTGHMTITTATEIGGVMLQPGNYDVREVKTADGPKVEFVRHVWNEQASELVQADEEVVVGRVNVSEQALGATPKHTQIVSQSNDKNTAVLEIRGDAVAYVFAEAPMNASSDDVGSIQTDGGQRQ